MSYFSGEKDATADLSIAITDFYTVVGSNWCNTSLTLSNAPKTIQTLLRTSIVIVYS